MGGEPPLQALARPVDPAFDRAEGDAEDFGDAGFYADLNATLGFKTVAGGATVAMTLVGREEKF